MLTDPETRAVDVDATHPIPVFGAGSIGLVLAARLARAGHAVQLCTRREADATLLRTSGVSVEEPLTGAVWHARVDAIAGAPAGERGPILVCVREPQNDGVAAAIAAASPDAILVNVQNGLGGDAFFATRFARVVGAVIRQTATRVAPNRVRAMTGGRLAVGSFPEGAGEDAHAVAALLRSAGYDVGVSQRIAEDRWLKLCVNLMSTPNALVRRDEHATRLFTEGKARLLEEARDALAAAGIAARSCDGRDRSLDAEIEYQRGALARGDAGRPLPLYNDLWQGLARGHPIEGISHHENLLAVARRAGVPAPTNERALAALRRVVAEGRGPESCSAEEVLGRS